MIVWLVASLGLVVLVVIAVAVGASLDTEAQRREWRRLADERRSRGADADEEQQRLSILCDRCPLRRLL